MTDRELMQQALDALEYAADQCKPEGLYGCNCLICKTILALRDSLAQPEQELVIDCPRCGHCCPQPNQEPVAWVCEGSSSDEKHAVDYQQEDVDAIPIGTMLYAAPPQRPWVGLTDEERQELAAEQHNWESLCFAVEAKIKQRNI